MNEDRVDPIAERRRWKAGYEDEHLKPAVRFLGILIELAAVFMALAGSGLFTARSDAALATAAVALAIAGLGLAWRK